MNGSLYFFAAVKEAIETATESYPPIRALMKTDPDTEGVEELKRFFIGEEIGIYVGDLTAINNILYFKTHISLSISLLRYDTGVSSTLWTSDGTAGGTVVVREFGESHNSSGMGNFYEVNGLLVFTHQVYHRHGIKLWRSDGTQAGTYALRDFAELLDFHKKEDGLLYFTHYSPGHGGYLPYVPHELWRTDGTHEGTVKIEVPCPNAGSILREYWAEAPGKEVNAIPVNTLPTATSNLTSFEGPADVADNYGSRISGYICPPQTGEYTFWIAGDDNCELWLSTDDDPANKVKIASVSGYTSYRQWNKYATQQSAPVTLVAGKRYYVEALHKEASGKDHVSVGWQLPNGIQERPISGNYLSPFDPLSRFSNYAPEVTLTAPASNATFAAGTNITLSATASDADGSVSKVEFFSDSTKLGEDTTSPYSFNWNNVPAGSYSLTARAIDNQYDYSFLNKTVKITVSEGADRGAPMVLYRINPGGTTIAASPISWSASSTNPSPYLTNGGNTSSRTFTGTNTTGAPDALFNTLRWDPGKAGDSLNSEMRWAFPVSPQGTYQVKLFFADSYSGTMAVGKRIFDVLIEGEKLLNRYDIYADAGKNATVKTFTVNVSDGQLNIDFLHVIENPLINGIEILALPVLYRVNAGGPAVADAGSEWSASSTNPSPYLTNGGNTSSRTFTGTNTTGAPNALFNTYRWDSGKAGDPLGSEMRWAFPVSAQGTYQVKLFFADTYAGTMAVGKRIFDVLIEGEKLLNRYDIYADAGKNATVKTFTVNVSDGQLNIDFLHVIENPQVNGIEIVSLGSEEENKAPAVAINSGGESFNASGNRQFTADAYYGGTDRTSSIYSGDILNTTDDVLYQTVRATPSFHYSIPVQSETVNVVLHFAETWWGAPGRGVGGVGKRLFHVDIEGSRKLTNYDIFAKAGGAVRAIQETIPITVTDGVLNINFLSGSADMPKISAIEVLTQTAATTTTAQLAATIIPEDEKASLAVFPNPNPGEKVFIEMSNFGGNEEVTLVLYDVQGRAIQTKTVVTNKDGAVHTTLLFHSIINRGVYNLVATAKTTKASAKLVLVK